MVKTQLSTQQKPKARVKAAPRKRKAFTNGFRPMIRSRHPTHDPLRNSLPRFAKRSVVRLGSEWAGDANNRIQINSAEAVRTSANKKLMKIAFDAHNIVTAPWCQGITSQDILSRLQLNEFVPIVAKSLFGSRGEGNTLLKSRQELDGFVANHTCINYIFEKFLNYPREYRLHLTKDGCFYTCRKMLKQGTPEANRWYRNDSNCVWIMEENPQFDKPVNWNEIVAGAVNALRAVGLDIGCIDVKVQSATDGEGRRRQAPKYFFIESGSAPSMGQVTLQKYLIELPRLINEKIAANQ